MNVETLYAREILFKHLYEVMSVKGTDKLATKHEISVILKDLQDLQVEKYGFIQLGVFLYKVASM